MHESDAYPIPSLTDIARANALDRFIIRRIEHPRGQPGAWLRSRARERAALGPLPDLHPFNLCVLAARARRQDVLLILLEEGIAPVASAHVDLGNESDRSWRWLLHTCASSNMPDVIPWLSRVISIDDTEPGGFTALMIAAANQAPEAALALLRLGADPFACAYNGCTPIFCAAVGDSPPIIEAILARGADPEAPALAGESTANYARARDKTNFLRIMDVFREARDIGDHLSPAIGTCAPRPRL